MQILVFLLTLALLTSCTGIIKNKKISKQTPNKTNPVLNKKEIQLTDVWVKKNLPDCKFLFNPPNSSITANNINTCIDTFRYSHQGEGSLQDKFKLHEAFIDIYLGERLSPHLLILSIAELTKILNTTLDFRYASNPKFIKTLLDRGVPTEHILLQRINWWSSNTDGCSVVMLILKKNEHLYKYKVSLNEPMPIKIGGRKPAKYPVYRRNVLFSFTYNHAHSVLCPNVIAELLQINPDLRDSIDSSSKTTPLHAYMDMFPDQLALGKKLISKNNINLQDSFGKTPLFILLEYVSSPDKRVIEMTKALLKSGAKIDLRNKEGITVRALIMKHPELKKLL